MTVVYPPLLELGSLQIESIKLDLKLAIEQKLIIQQELLKPGLSNDEIRALQQQLVILESRITLYNSQLNRN
jgi:flagellar biosynthesis chaperone FliJ